MRDLIYGVVSYYVWNDTRMVCVMKSQLKTRKC